MAKSIEQKAVDAVITAMNQKDFRHHEFSRLMVESGLMVSREFMNVVYSYISYLATFDEYRYYPFGCQEVAEVAGKVRDTFDEALGVEFDENGFYKV